MEQLVPLLQRLTLGRKRRELAKRLHEVEVGLVKLTLDLREMERNIIEADVEELRMRFGQHFPRPPDLPSNAHDADVSKHDPHQDTSQD